MKKQQFSYLIFTLLVTTITFVGCQQEDIFDDFNDKGVYLSLPYNVNFNELTESDLDIISQAFFRLNIIENEDGLFEIGHTCGRDINVSEELFEYFQLIVDDSNEQILSEIYYTRDKVQTRQESVGTRTDCVARSIAYATGGNYNSINTAIINRYGSGGVPSHQFYQAMNQHCNGAQVSFSMFNGMSIPNGRRYIIVVNYSHAVNIEMKSGSNIIYWDAQNNRRGVCSASSITHIYEVR